MTEPAAQIPLATDVETLLRGDLDQSDRALAGVAPVLSYLLASSGQSLISDDLLARMRGMLSDIAGQLLRIQEEATAPFPFSGGDDQSHDSLMVKLAANTRLLSHCFAVAVEAQLSEELELRLGLDQVLSPLMQELIASKDAKLAELAMAAMSAQARFVQARRRMGLSLNDLPADIFHSLMASWNEIAGSSAAATRAKGEALLRANYDESLGRTALLTRLVGALGGAARAALAVDHAGVALFVTSLAALSKQPRELAALSCHETQGTRLALALRSTDLSPERVIEQVAMLHPGAELPQEVASIAADRARGLLEESRSGVDG